MEEEISLRELIEVLLRGKWIVAGISFVAVLAAGVLSFFVLPEKYEAKATIMFDNKFVAQQGLSLESYKELVTDYSRIEFVYNRLELDKKGYTITSLEESIKTEINKDAGQIEITAVGTDPKLVQKIVNILGENSVADFKKRLIADKEREIIKAERILKSIEAELESTPKLLNNFEIKNQGAQQVIQIPEVNPLFEKLSARWDDLNYSVFQLEAEKKYLEEGLESGGNGLYIMLQKAPLPKEPVAPRKMLNMAVAGVLGLMVGIFLVFFLEFWRKSAPENTDISA